MNQIERVFIHVTNIYDAVCYTTGNHELWRRGSLKSPRKECANSIIKFDEVLELARSYDIKIGPVRFSESSSVPGLCIFPLFSWYHSGWDTEPDLTHTLYRKVQNDMPFHTKWADFQLCSWPEDLIKHSEFANINKDNSVLAQAFAQLNEKFLTPSDEILVSGMSVTVGNTLIDYADGAQVSNDTRIKPHDSDLVHENDTVISFSHYLPRQELCPEKRFLLEPLLSRVIGSVPLENQIRRLRPNLHLFGHTHIPVDLEVDGIRYLQWPLGYTRESEKQCESIVNKGPMLVYDSRLNGIPAERPSLDSIWSKYYSQNKRDPAIVDQLSSWLLSRLNAK